MTAPPVPEEPSDSSGEFAGFAPPGLQRNKQKSARLLLTDEQWRLEHLLAAAVALEFIRVVAPSDPRTTAKYAATTVDNSRLLAVGNPKLHLSLLRGQLKWLRGLKHGELS
jgi:hypothetical protein